MNFSVRALSVMKSALLLGSFLAALGIGIQVKANELLISSPEVIGSVEVSQEKFGFSPYIAPPGPPKRFLTEIISEQAGDAKGGTTSPGWYELIGPRISLPGKVTIQGGGSTTPFFYWSMFFKQYDPTPTLSTTLGSIVSPYGEPKTGGVTVQSFPAGYRPGASSYNYNFTGWASWSFSPTNTGGRVATFFSESNEISTNLTVVRNDLRIQAVLNDPIVVGETQKYQIPSTVWTPCRRDWSLSDEFTTQMLEDYTFSKLEAMGWPTNVSGRSALRDLSDNEFVLTLRKVLVLYRFSGTENQMYLVQIDGTFVSGTQSHPDFRYMMVRATGKEQQVLVEFEPPSQDGEYIPGPARFSPANAAPPGRSGDPNNETNGGAPCPGDANSQVRSVQVEFGLGTSGFDQAIGRLWVHELYPNNKVANVRSLHAVVDPDSAELIETNGIIQQIKSDHLLVDVLAEADSRYSVRYYHLTNEIPKVAGRYVPSEAAYAIWTVEAPDAEIGLYDYVTVSESRGGHNVVQSFLWSEADQGWELVSGNGLRRESKFNVNQTGPTGPERIETASIYNPDNSLAQQTRRKYGVFNIGELLVEEVFGPSESALTNTYSYYTNGLIQQVTRYDGSWEKRFYDSANRLTKTVQPFQNAAPTAAESQSIVTEYDYSTNSVAGSGDDGLENPWSPRFVQKSVPSLGLVLLRQYSVHLPGEVQVYTHTTGTPSWTNAANLRSVTRYYTNTEMSGRIASVQAVNGVLTTYLYETNSTGTLQTNTVSRGEPDSGGTVVIDGTRTMEVVDSSGRVHWREVYDITSGILVSRETLSDPDAEGRFQTVTLLDGTTEHTSYNCCGVEATVDRAGTVTNFEYDDLKRQTGATRSGVKQITTYDAAGHLSAVTRRGTNGTERVQSTAGYDLAGRLRRHTNAVGCVTLYSEGFDSSGYFARTNVFAAGTTNSAAQVQQLARDGSVTRISGNAVHGMRFSYTAQGETLVKRTIFLNEDGTDSQEWTETITDAAGREVEERAPVDATHTASTIYEYNGLNQLFRKTTSDGVVTLYKYNGKGDLVETALDMNRNGEIDYAGTDRITRVEVGVVEAHGTEVYRTQKYAWLTNGLNSSTLFSTTDLSTDGLNTWTIQFGLTNHSKIFLAGAGERSTTNRFADGSYEVVESIEGRRVSARRSGSDDIQVGAVSFDYDEFGRVDGVTDARNGRHTYGYDDADRVTEVISPVPGAGLSAQRGTTEYDSAGQPWRITAADGGTVTNAYYATGELKSRSGARTYPVEQSYDYRGRLKTLLTWQDFAGDAGKATNTWIYDSFSGQNTRKLYEDGKGPAYRYYTTTGPVGRLHERQWQRGTTATYSYNNAGEIETVTYSDSTLGLSYVYDRAGRLNEVTQGTNSWVLNYNAAGQLLSETSTFAGVSGAILSYGQDELHRRSSINFSLGSINLNTELRYDEASRLSVVSNGVYAAKYDYVPNSPLYGSIRFSKDGLLVARTERNFDYLNRLNSIFTTNAVGAVIASSGYLYNDVNQRTRRNEPDGSRWDYQYDNLGQVTVANKRWNDNSPVAGQQFEYGFDDIGNRVRSARGGNDSGDGLAESLYTPNLLNQLDTRTVPGSVDVFGTAVTNATVTVNFERAERKGEYFHGLALLNNATNSVFQFITNIAVVNNGTNADIIATNLTGVYLPASQETFVYDDDGNLLQDGRWNYTWNAENRLIAMETRSMVPSGARKALEFQYDYQGRRIWKRETDLDASASFQRKFAYDGWNLVAELDDGNSLVRSYIWGLDLSGTIQGAGGVGGLLAIRNADSSTHLVSCDGNGNVSTLIDAATGQRSAEYEYGPFGEPLRATGPMASVNPFRFSTKYADETSGLIYYGFRYCSIPLGRWLNHDPIGELGGLNLYGFTYNNPINNIDTDGRFVESVVATIATTSGTVSSGGAGITITVTASTGAGAAAGGAATGIGAAAALPATVTAIVGGGIGYGIGHYTGFHQGFANFLFPDPSSAPLPLPGFPPGPPRRPPTTTTVSAPCPGPNGRGGENEATVRGREAHKWYNYPSGFRTDFRFENGLRPDAINFQTRQILELKPNNPEAIARGMQQLQRYIQQATREFGGNWTGRVVTYE